MKKNKKIKENSPAPAPARTVPKPRTPDVPMPTRTPAPTPSHPLRPKRRPAPKPKAQNHDLELFLRKRLGIKEMAFEVGDYPDWVSRDKKQWIETTDELEKLLPTLTSAEQSYLELITSNEYQGIVSRLEGYLGKPVQRGDLPTLFGQIYTLLDEIIQIERDYKSELEELAVSVLLELPEFRMIKDLYDSGDISFDARLTTMDDISDMLSGGDKAGEEDGLDEAEQATMEIADALGNLDDRVLQRRFNNMLIQGGAQHKMHLFQMVSRELKAIDPQLPQKYGVMASLTQLGYWVLPFGVEQQGAEQTAAGGAEVDVSSEEGADVIKGRGIMFPILVHELAKGLYEYLSLTDEQDVEAERVADTLKHETKDIMVGQGLYRTIQQHVPTDKMEYFPLIWKKVTKLPYEQIQEILAKSERGRRIMTGILMAAEKEMSDYENPPEPEEDDYDFDFDDDYDDDWGQPY